MVAIQITTHLPLDIESPAGMGASHLDDRYAWLSFSQPDFRVFPACSCFFLHKIWLMPVVVLAGLALRASEQMRPWAVCWALESSLRDMRRTKCPCWRYTCGICKAWVSKSCGLWSWCYQKWVCIKHIFISGYKIMCPWAWYLHVGCTGSQPLRIGLHPLLYVSIIPV